MQKNHRVPEFPVEVEINHTKESNAPVNFLLGVLQVSGFLIAVVGVLSLLFSPESVWVNREKGMSFLQFIQIYPGPMITVALLMMSMQYIVRIYLFSRLQRQFLLSVYEELQLDNEEIPVGQELSYSVVSVEGDWVRIRVDLIESNPDKNPTL